MAGPHLSWGARPLISSLSGANDCRVTVNFCDHQILALVDTGATVSVISSDYMELLSPSAYPLFPVNTSLLSVNGSNVDVLGM